MQLLMFVLLCISVVCDDVGILQPEALLSYQFTEQISGNLDHLIPTSAIRDKESGISYDAYTILMERTTQQILPSVYPKTPIFAYGGLTKKGLVISFPAPSLIAKYKVPTKVKWVNNIYGSHMFAVDFNQPFNSSLVYRNQIPLVPHAHGVATKTSSDGQPGAYWTALGSRGPRFATLVEGMRNEAIFQYPNEQEPGIFWYHDHTCGLTRLNVYAGLVGLYQIVSASKSREQQALENYYGQLVQKELVIADRTFKVNGQLYYSNSTTNVHFSSWVPEFYGNTIVVNGKVWPKMVLQQQKYRIIMLNACQARYLNLFFLNNGKKLPFDLIRTEGDYFNSPVRVTEYLFTLSARIQIVLDLTSVRGQVFLKNNAQAPYPVGDPENLIDKFTGTIIKFQIKKAAQPQVSQSKLVFLNSLKDKNLNLKKQVEINKKNDEIVIAEAKIKQAKYPAFPEGKHIFTTIIEVDDDEGNQSSGMFIDGISFQTSSDCKNSKYKLGQTYDFYMINLTPDSHPMHFHLINFQKIAMIPFDADAYTQLWFKKNGGPPGRTGYKTAPIIIDPSPFFTGPAEYPQQHEKTFRDIVDMHPDYVTIIRIRFSHNDGQPFSFDTRGSSYVFHCHMLEHEDNDMMRYFCIE